MKSNIKKRPEIRKQSRKNIKFESAYLDRTVDINLNGLGKDDCHPGCRKSGYREISGKNLVFSSQRF